MPLTPTWESSLSSTFFQVSIESKTNKELQVYYPLLNFLLKCFFYPVFFFTKTRHCGPAEHKETKKRATQPSDSLLKDFKGQTQALRGVLIPRASFSKADKPEADMPSEVKEPVEAERIHSMIKSGRDLDTKVVSHPIYKASVYSLNAIVDFIFTVRSLATVSFKLCHTSSSWRYWHI